MTSAGGRSVADKKYRLTKIKLDEVSLVGSGDDARANVVLSKSDSVEGESDSIPANQLGGNGMGRKQGTPAIIDKSALPDDVQEYINSLEEVILAKDDDDGTDDDTSDDGDLEVDDEFEDDEADDDSNDEDEDDQEVESKDQKSGVKVGKNSPKAGQAQGEGMRKVLAKADPEVRELIAKMDQRIQRAEAIAKHERDERENREWIAKAATLTHINDKPEELGGLLKSLHDKAPNEADAVEKLLRAANAQVAKTGLWDEIGRTGGSFTGSALEGQVAELRKADPNLTREQAEARAFENDPSLYDEYLAGR